MAQAKNSAEKSGIYKALVGVVIVLGAVLVALVGYQTLFAESAYSAVYLRSGDLYFGKIVRFPYFGLKNVYMLQATQDPTNPLRIQKFSQVFWGPEDYLRLNREEIVWHTHIRSDSQLAELLKTNPELAQPQQQAPVQQIPPTIPAEEEPVIE